MAPYFGLTGGWLGFYRRESMICILIILQAHILGTKVAERSQKLWTHTKQVSVACSTDMTLFGYDQGVFGTPGLAEMSSFLTGSWGADRGILGGVIVTPDFLDTLKLNGPENTSLVGTVTALCRSRDLWSLLSETQLAF